MRLRCLLITLPFTPVRYITKVANSICVFYVIYYHKVHKMTPKVRQLSNYCITILNQMGDPGLENAVLPPLYHRVNR
jgi:hypothetical protein